ncbi:APC family permease [Marinisporobacter balticus]|uniref:Amino acid/polyamine/organocation transporter (APC superfamily) n=1 Tax=Marinisporobacter balticus TaxID=2018667 RepID=A0A4R2L634_9FIRM|nr:amino acid permease [Marinisporobacter balticus]TCO79519.1 amino acid/polyamine/organocation transporter (APC superfamily) [Marinisporobacter balticus]
MTQKRENLEKVYSKGDVLALAFGAMVGWGWVMLAGYWVKEAGWVGAMGAFLIGAVMCIFVGLCYAELTPALPCAGGGMVFAYRGMGYTASWITIWATCFAYIGVAAWEGIAISTAIDYVIPIPKAGYLWTIAGYDVYFSWCAVGMAVGLILLIVNYMGGKSAALFQTIATIGLTGVGVLFIVGGTSMGNAEFMGDMYTSGKGLISVLLMAPAMYVGFDVIPQSAEEMNIPLKQIAKILILSIFMAAAWYILMILGIAKACPIEVRNNGAVPVADAAAYLFGSAMWGKILIIGALCGILTSWNGFIVGGARVLFAMGRAKMLPPVFGKVHPKTQSPYAAIILIGIICLLSPLMGKNALVWFVNASSFGVVITYLMVCISFVCLRKKEPNLERPFKVSNGVIIGWVAIIISVIFISLYLPFSPGALVWPYEWGMILGWIVLGVILAVMTKKAYPDVTDKEREYLMFGEKYARKEIIGKGSDVA